MKKRAFHFLRDGMKSGYGSEPPWKIGEERTIEGVLKMCEHGYHSSPTWYDALKYAPGNMACIVEVSGVILKDTDKQVSSSRKLIKAKDSGRVLRNWACDCAERALKKAKVKDERIWNAVRVARLYNEGKATKKELGVAKAAAWAVARTASMDAAWAVARTASMDAAWDAAWAAVMDATMAAAWDAAWAAAKAAARNAAWAAAKAAVMDATMAAAWDATWAAAWNAAMDAEKKWQQKQLDKLMNELFKES